MANRARGEVDIVLDGEPHAMRLTLGALAGLETALAVPSLVALAERFEGGAFCADDLLKLLSAGLNGAGHEIDERALGAMEVAGGPVGAARAAAQLLAATFGDG